MKNSALYITTTTFDSSLKAKKICKKLLKKKHIGCGQVSGPIFSYYTWKEKRKCTKEFVLTIKTVGRKIKKVESFLRKHHPYTTSQFVVTKVDYVSRGYMDWIEQEVV